MSSCNAPSGGRRARNASSCRRCWARWPVCVALVVLQHNWRAALVTSFIFAIIWLSLVVVTGYAGQVSLAQLTLAGVAGFLLATMTTEWSIPFPIAPIVAALGATVVGVIVGLPAIRVRGLFVAVVTLAMAYAVQAVWFHNSDYVPAKAGTSPARSSSASISVHTSAPTTPHPVLPRRARRAGDRRGVRRVAAPQPTRLRDARGPGQRTVRRRRRHQRRAGQDPRVRHRRVHRRPRRRHARLQTRQPHVRPVRRPHRHRRIRHRLPRRHHLGLRRHPRRDARRRRHRLLRDHPMARPR